MGRERESGAPIFNFFRERNKWVFFLLAKIYGALLHLLIYFGSYLSYLFSRLLNISGFLLYWPLFVVTVHTVTALLLVMCFWHILHISLIQFRSTTTMQIWRVYWSTFVIYIVFLVLTAALCVGSSDVIVCFLIVDCYHVELIFFSKTKTKSVYM